MPSIQGVGGCLFVVSERAPLNLSLVDCDHGFDWGSPEPARSLWLEDDLRVSVDELPVEPLDVDPLHGTVGFGKCFEGRHVRVSGYYRPVSLVAEATYWGVDIPIGEDGSCVLTDWLMDEPPAGQVLVHLPSGRGAFRALGRLQDPVAGQPLRVVIEGEIRHGGSIS